MSYKNWEYSWAQLAISADWFEIFELMKALQTVKRNHLVGISHALRAAHTLIFIDTPHSAPYNKRMRFPKDELYICDLVGCWNTNLEKLRPILSLGIKEQPTETDDELEQIFETVQLEQPVVDIAKYYELITELLSDLAQQLFVFDQNVFESWGCVKWIDEKDEEKERGITNTNLSGWFCRLYQCLHENIVFLAIKLRDFEF